MLAILSHWNNLQNRHNFLSCSWTSLLRIMMTDHENCSFQFCSLELILLYRSGMESQNGTRWSARGQATISVGRRNKDYNTAYASRSQESPAEDEGKACCLPDAQTLSDLFMIAPFRIMPSVWPVPSSSSVAFVTCTLEGMIIGTRSLRMGKREDM